MAVYPYGWYVIFPQIPKRAALSYTGRKCPNQSEYCYNLSQTAIVNCQFSIHSASTPSASPASW